MSMGLFDCSSVWGLDDRRYIFADKFPTMPVWENALESKAAGRSVPLEYGER